MHFISLVLSHVVNAILFISNSELCKLKWPSLKMQKIEQTLKNYIRTFLLVQWLRLHVSTRGAQVLSPGRGTKISHVAQYSQNRKEKNYTSMSVIKSQMHVHKMY